MNFIKYKNNGLTGLVNVGNTCYLNSCMQLLSHTYELNELLEQNNLEINKCIESKIFLEWNSLRKMMWSENCCIAPYGFVKTVQHVSKIKNNIFTEFSQNDVFEFLLFIIDCLHESLKRKVKMNINGVIKNDKDFLAKKCFEMIKNVYNNEYSEIINIFYGTSVTHINDFITNKSINIIAEPFSILSLCIPNNKASSCSIINCFDLYTQKEELINENQVFNEATGKKQNAIKTISFWSLPNVLIIELKRYTNNNNKIKTIISTPLIDLNLSKYISGYNPESYVYDLFGTGNHFGNTTGGHYTSNIKNPNGKWYSFNDNNINEITEDKIINANTYSLFYRKK
jgi:ubiquitin carboxyl-terminal hydrolase 8